jgi:bifunctional non-homologous end joining protein LigD
VPVTRDKADFIEPMLLLAAESLPEGPGWTHELKLDGYRALGIKAGATVRLRSRNDKDFNGKYPAIARALPALPDETVVDGEVVALSADGRPSLNALQNGSAGATIVYYVFDVMILAGRNVMGETLATRRDLLTREVLPKLAEPVREAPRFDAALADLIAAVRAQGLEGLVAKLLDSVYEPGARSGAWRKMRLNRSEGFVVGGYTRGGRTFDALVLGRYEGERLGYVARTRIGFTPASRMPLMEKLRPLEIPGRPFANLAGTGGARASWRRR